MYLKITGKKEKLEALEKFLATHVRRKGLKMRMTKENRAKKAKNGKSNQSK